MDDKKLNLNRPLLSVRRGLSTTVPEVDRRKTSNPLPAIPPLPYYKSELKSGPVRNPGVVPFQWEQIPGKPKDNSKLLNEANKQLSDSPKLPSGRAVECGSVENDGTSGSDSSSLYKNAEFERRDGNGSSVSDGDNSTYVDAVDSLSRESLLDCSVTGLDCPKMKPTDRLSDPLARDLMMGRFLPAAKAVASENPHFGPKKQTIRKEQPREAMRVTTPISLPQHPQFEDEEEDTEEEEEDIDLDFGGNEQASVKLCGLLPRFCLLNPIPGIRDQPISSVRQMSKKPANLCAFNKTDKAIRDAVYERRRLAVYKKSDMRVGADRLKHELNELFPQSDLMKLNEANDSKGTFRRKAQRRSPESLAAVIAQEEPAHVKTTIEKTLYIDSAQITEYRDSNSSSSESRGRNPSIDYSLHDIKDLYYTDNNSIPSQTRNTDTSESRMLQTEKRNGQKQNPCNQLPHADVKNNVLPFLLPKSPSESWLSRALPSVSSRNSRSYGNSGNLGFRSSPVNPSSKLHNKQFELPALTPISEN